MVAAVCSDRISYSVVVLSAHNKTTLNTTGIQHTANTVDSWKRQEDLGTRRHDVSCLGDGNKEK